MYSFILSAYWVKPYYYWFYNSLMVPPSSIQSPMYDQGLPLAVNYGGMGSYIANALIRPYDEFGELYTPRAHCTQSVTLRLRDAMQQMRTTVAKKSVHTWCSSSTVQMIAIFRTAAHHASYVDVQDS